MQSKYLSGLSLKSIEKHAIRKLFITAVIVGSIGIAFGTIIGSPWVAIAVPVLVLSGYIAWTVRAEVDVPALIIGDSYYYLGFILTLVALTASLVSLGDADVSISNIIGSFGAAMTTTIIGLVARLVTTTFSMESTERRERLDREIEREIDRFLAQLRTMTEKVTGDFVAITTDIGQAALDTKDAFKNTGDELNTTTKAISEKIDMSVNDLCSRINQVKVDPHLVEKSVTNALETFSSETSALSVSYKDATDKVAAVNGQLVTQYESFEDSMSKRQDKLIGIFSESAKEQVEVLNRSLESVAAAVAGNKGELQSLTTESKQAMADATQAYIEQVEAQKAVIREINNNIEDVKVVSLSAAKIMNKHHEVLEKEAALFDEKSGSIATLRELNESLIASLASAKKHIELQDDVLAASSQKMETSLSAVEQASLSLKSMNELAAKDLRELYNSLTSALQQFEAKVD
ncbi:hypothetical protein ALT761_00918 [Alteromonas sp. 76-1]|uniref:hypothetical protein n=1 Tax=Alteromonas sp. 76-1 TaxID=2358187 RepID=UPI000FD161A7|nr:hypothetical protein [Alteromonas sp. 76-1]VEL95959.1 hypothetical protein ALT761_00918 [Alteromonas sp. 76-1]